MKYEPIILVAPNTVRKGAEFADDSISLSNRYTDAIIASGGLPQIFPATTTHSIAAEAVQRCDGLLLTGGDDVDSKLYDPDMPKELLKNMGPVEKERDAWEKDLIAQAFDQRKGIMGICRGQQILNVALGGTLVVDIAAQLPNALNHRQMERRSEPVHEVRIAPDSILARAVGRQTLSVNSTHHQAVGKVAPPLRAVAQSSDGLVEALELKEPGRLPFLLSVQWHPERLIDGNAIFLQLFKSFVAACERGPQRNL